jgi:regulator of protease activity HflC (stomatin/prohibitin superfamily)
MRSTSSVATLVFIVILAIGGALIYTVYGISPSWGSTWLIIAAFILATVVSLAIKVADQWNRAIVLRLGRFHALRGPGLFLIVPIIDTIPLLDRHPGDHLGIQRRTHAHQ